MGGKKGDMMEKKPRRDTEKVQGAPKPRGDEQDTIGEISALQQELRHAEGGLYEAGKHIKHALGAVLAGIAIANTATEHVMKAQERIARHLEKLSEEQCRSIEENSLTQEGVDLMAAAKAQHDNTAEQPIPSEDQALIEFLQQSSLLTVDPNDPETKQTYPVNDLIDHIMSVVEDEWNAMGNPFVYGAGYEPSQQWPFTFEASLVTAYQEAIGEASANPIEVVKGILEKVFSPNVMQYVKAITMTGAGDKDREIIIITDPRGAGDGSPLNQLGRYLETTCSKKGAKALTRLTEQRNKHFEKAAERAGKVDNGIERLLNYFDELGLDIELDDSSHWLRLVYGD